MTTRSRGYCFTINNYTFDDLIDIFSLDGDYIVIGFEIGKENTNHIQGYVHFLNQKCFNTVKKVITRAHIEHAKGTPVQASEYCKKDGEYYEFGEIPISGVPKFERIEAAMQNPEDNPHLFQQYRKVYKDIVNLRNKGCETRYYVYHPVCDPITTIIEYFDYTKEDNLAVVTDLSDLEAYDKYDHVIYFAEFFDKKHVLWPRGVPITYKYGYETKVVYCNTFIIVTDTPNLYPLYNKI